MICATLKQGMECSFMTKSGCGFNGGSCHTIVEQCSGCQKVLDLPAGQFCTSYPNPGLKWKTTVCNFATHAKAESLAQQQSKINPLKASKRATKKK